MGFSERLKEERLKKGLKQRELAEMIKTTNTSVSNWEKGISRPSAGSISLLAQALEVSPFDLLGRYTLHDIREVNSKDPSERNFEDSMALTFSNELLKAAGIELNNMISDTLAGINRNIKELGSAIQSVCQDNLLNNEGKIMLFAYDTLNNNGKILLLEYLTGLLRVPTYLQESEYGLDEELITDLNAEKESLKNSKQVNL